jgi:glutathione peroxidase-family protein
MLCRRLTSNLAILLIAGLVPGVLLGGAPEAQLSERPPSLAGVEAFSAPLNEGNALIGIRPDGWTARDWINSEPLALDALRGKVVLVRWWTAPGCAFCEASAPALNNFWMRYGSRGLVVVGFYHHKSSEPLSLANVKRQSRKFGFEFPVAIDPDWKTLRRWWLNKHDRGWTSVTFLLDRRGVIRHVHPGGAFFKGEPGYELLEKKIQELLDEHFTT